REELVEQVPVGHVEFDDVKAHLMGPAGRLDEGLGHLLQPLLVERGGRSPVGGEGEGAGGDGLLGPVALLGREGLRPAWASCTPQAAPCSWTKRTIRSRAGSWAGSQRPRSRVLIRPRGSTAV